jgi:voltage-gated potassium channel
MVAAAHGAGEQMAKSIFEQRSAQVIITELYRGRSEAAVRFRFGLLAFDVAVIVSFIVTTIVGLPQWLLILDVVFAVVIAADLTARYVIKPSRKAYFLDIFNWTDFIVVLSLTAPAVFGTFAFLRALRALRIMRSVHVLRDLRRSSRFFRQQEEVIERSLNLLVFIFIVSAFVFALQSSVNPGISNYTDALYFTVTALTTTGFGDIVLIGDSGRWLSILILGVGVGLFLRLAQSIFRPNKVRHKCPGCGLLLHEPDAVHCKHCGREIQIESKGEAV